ncbi:integral membrane protein GPR155 homolog anchor isoform X2 [Rhodnius prolixus]|uniref:integral membrane protein GPR155 homolog anchor isoform X2 n=1 Tax=Rhodnius prolixus TaxID=13249 RepID=UPI003D18D0F4
MGGVTSLDSEVPLENLYPALIECFGVIICGYVAGRLGVVSEQQTSGLATFVGTFSLPSLIFLSLSTLDLSSICWYFLLSIFISKALVFASVLLITLLVTRPVDPGKSGLYAIFCTQSNDFAIGYPIVMSVYGKTHPFVSYLYLLAPVSLVMLNPIGFVLMEIGRRKGQNASKLQLLLSTMTSIAANPVVLMTALGIAGNFIFHHHIPVALSAILNAFGSAFTATALFLLGLRMVGNVRNFRGEALLVPAILIAVKELVLPLVIREISSLILHSAKVNSTESIAMSTYGFLYGTFPSAPGVFVYATSYALDVDLIASAMVACTFISAPLMFISAKMVSVSNLSPKDFIPSLERFEFDLSIVGVFACVILLVVFTIKRSIWSLPQKITMCIIVSQLFGCMGVLLGGLNISYIEYVEFYFVKLGDLSSRIWTACLAICLALMESRNYATVFHLLPIFFGVAWCLPIVLITVMMLSVNFVNPHIHPGERFVYGTVEAGITIFILLVSLIVSVVYLVLQQRYKRRYARYLVYSREANATYDNPHGSQDINSSQSIREDEPVLPIPKNEIIGSNNNDDTQPLHHLALLFFLVCSIFINLSLCIWRVIMEDITGVYVELSFLDTSLTRGQCLIVLFIFGLDIISLLHPLFKRFLDTFSQGEPIVLPSMEDLPTETQHLCDQFNTYHIQPCKAQIVRRKRLKLWEFVSCFSGEDLVSWLLAQGLVKDREEGIVYGSHLLTGRVIRHVNNTQHFTDDSALFVFQNN